MRLIQCGYFKLKSFFSIYADSPSFYMYILQMWACKIWCLQKKRNYHMLSRSIPWRVLGAFAANPTYSLGVPVVWQSSFLLVETAQFNSQFNNKLISHSNWDISPVSAGNLEWRENLCSLLRSQKVR